MKKILVVGLVLMLVFSLSGLTMAAKLPEGPSYRAIPLKALDTCIDACGEPPDGEDLEASEEYQMCVGDCHPKIDFLHQTVDSFFDMFSEIGGLIQDLQEQINTIELTPGPKGDSCTISGTVVSCEDGTSADVQGPPGINGSDGEQGPPGPQGEQGPQGEPGQQTEVLYDNTINLCGTGDKTVHVADQWAGGWPYYSEQPEPYVIVANCHWQGGGAFDGESAGQGMTHCYVSRIYNKWGTITGIPNKPYLNRYYVTFHYDQGIQNYCADWRLTVMKLS